jgi:hypothetical protein
MRRRSVSQYVGVEVFRAVTVKNTIYLDVASRDSAVSIATGYGLDD